MMSGWFGGDGAILTVIRCAILPLAKVALKKPQRPASLGP